MAALALMTAACSNDDNDLTTQQPQKAEGITITAQLAPKTNGATTRAVSEGSGIIVSEWAENEHIAVLYEVGGTKYAADATITAVDGSGTATISFTVEAGTANDTPCTLVYPLSAAKDDHTGVKDVATLLAAQNGTLNANLDVRVGAGTIQTSTPGLTVTTQPAAQFAIFKFTTKNSGGTATIDVKPLTITIGAQNYVITPALATSELYVALPAVSSGQTVSFSATGSDSKTYICSKASVTFAAGKYYQSTLKMAQTVTWTASDMSGLMVLFDGRGAYNNTIKGITVTASGGGGMDRWTEASRINGESGTLTFTSTVGKIKSIVISAEHVNCYDSPTGWTVNNYNNPATLSWSGDPSNTVEMPIVSDLTVYNISSIVFTLE